MGEAPFSPLSTLSRRCGSPKGSMTRRACEPFTGRHSRDEKMGLLPPRLHFLLKPKLGSLRPASVACNLFSTVPCTVQCIVLCTALCSTLYCIVLYCTVLLYN